MAEVFNRRRNLLIDKKFQSKFIAVTLTMLIALALGFFVLWFASFADMPAADLAGGHHGPLTGGVILLLTFILVLIIITVFYGLRFSHRIVGPVFAFNRHLNWIKEGNYARDLRLRDGDEFENLAMTFNAMQSALRKRVRDDLETVGKVQKLVGEFHASVESGSFNTDAASALLGEVRNGLAQLQKRGEGILAG